MGQIGVVCVCRFAKVLPGWSVGAILIPFWRGDGGRVSCVFYAGEVKMGDDVSYQMWRFVDDEAEQMCRRLRSRKRTSVTF